MGELKKVVKKSKTKKKLLKKRKLKKELAAVKERLGRSREDRLNERAGLEGDGGVKLEVKKLDDVVKLSMKLDDKLEDIDGGKREVVDGEPGAGGKSKSSVLAKAKRKKVDANWATIKRAIGAGKRKRRSPPTVSKPTDVTPVEEQKVGHATKALALDCEMVGVGPDGRRNALARIAVVNSKLEAVYHAWVRPSEKVVDYRTQYSGVRPEDVLSDVAVSFSEAQQTVADLLKDRILVGHAVSNDLDVLLLGHPRHSIRDTSTNPLIRAALGISNKKGALALRRLAAELLGEEIQTGEHNPHEDAKASMRLYLKFAKQWESSLRDKKKVGGKGKKKDSSSASKHNSRRSNLPPTKTLTNPEKTTQSFLGAGPD
ncbi:hypothetical protein NDN08_003068 [Rhodosorus marinus]|uniref:RNA exonuclease 4 n=1 Tax=Rhodosorus marinus TaxID=101924 RepID=A0AAV8UVG0_9RHOD|nr:hypothetical protein NDN08_003068 [Rhodosorus marinus]